MILYHFTNIHNLRSIKQNGLMSWANLEKKHIAYYSISNDLSRHLDRRYDLQDYVRFCKSTNHPMLWVAQREGRISYNEKCWLQMEFDTLAQYDFEILFSNKNATANDAIINDNIHTFLNSDDRQAEVLIKGIIPSDLLKIAETNRSYYPKAG